MWGVLFLLFTGNGGASAADLGVKYIIQDCIESLQ